METDPSRIGIMLGLLVFSAFFSSSESALFSLDTLSLRRLRGMGVSGRTASMLLDRPDRLLVTILFGNMLVNVAYIVLAASVSRGLGEAELSAVWSAGTLLALIVCGEVTPKALAVSNPVGISRMVALPLALLVGTVGRGLQFLSRGWLREDGTCGGGALSPEELKLLVELSARNRGISRGESEMLVDVLALAEVKVREVMVPSIDVVTVPKGARVKDVLEKAAPGGTRFLPVVDPQTDRVEGMVDFVECLGAVVEKGPPALEHPIEGFLVEAVFVPETAPCSKILEILQRTGGVGPLVVADEYGGFAGLVTAEDVVEVFLGPLRDEFEISEERDPEEIAPGVFRVPGDLPVREWLDLLGVESVSGDVPVSTVAGLFVYLAGRHPKQGDRVRIGNLVLEASAVEGFRLLEVLVRLEPSSGETEGKDVESAVERDGVKP